MKTRALARLVAGGVLVVAVAGCDDAATPPTTVVVNTPPDGGPVVLLTVMIAVAFLALSVAAVCGWNWATERRNRRDAEAALRDAEDTVLALTGQPISRVRPQLFRAGNSVSWSGESRRVLNPERFSDD